MIYRGAIRPINKEQPMITRFLLERSDTNCRLDRPTAVTILKLTNIAPPSTGSGIMVSTAPNLPQKQQIRKISPAA